MIKRIVPFLLLLLACLGVSAADPGRITLTITITNVPTTSNTLTINASSRYWTNSVSASTFATNLVSTNYATTNLFNAIASYPYSGLILSYVSSNKISLLGSYGAALAGSMTGGWADITTVTQSGPSTFTALWPIENMVGATNRTNEASALVYGLSTFSTQAYATNATAVSNLIQKGAGPLQIAIGPIQLNQLSGTNAGLSGGTYSNASFRGAVVALTNGYWTNAILGNPTMTNGVNYGTAFSSPGSASGSEQFGATAVASGINSFAAGDSASASTRSSVAINGAAAGNFDITIGGNASGGGGLALGVDSQKGGTNSIVIGTGANDGNFTNAVVIGAGGLASAHNQIILGSSQHTVTIGGLMAGLNTSNLVHKGTNVINGRVDFTSRANTSPANGNNSGVILGTNVYVRISGPTTIGAYAGFAAEQDGSWHIVSFTGAVTNTFYNNSGLDATAANRITTGTGGDLSYTNNPLVVLMVYDATTSRWIINSLLR